MSGLGPAAVGSAPNAAIFFCTYDTVKRLAVNKFGYQVNIFCVIFYVHVSRVQDSAAVHMVAASTGEVAACLVRVPVEIVKQRRQARAAGSSVEIVRDTWRGEGARGFYRGYLTTVIREIPFSLIQFPLWEGLKKQWAVVTGHQPKPWYLKLYYQHS